MIWSSLYTCMKLSKNKQNYFLKIKHNYRMKCCFWVSSPKNWRIKQLYGNDSYSMYSNIINSSYNVEKKLSWPTDKWITKHHAYMLWDITQTYKEMKFWRMQHGPILKTLLHEIYQEKDKISTVPLIYKYRTYKIHMIEWNTFLGREEQGGN